MNLPILRDFYEIIERKAGEGIIAARIKLNKNHIIYNGHFPAAPVVPGVCQIQMVREIIESTIDRTLFVHMADNVKFMSVINPELNETLIFNISYQIQDGGIISCKGAISWETITFLKFQIKLSERLNAFG